MLDFDAAQTRLVQCVQPPSQHENIALDGLTGRVLAADVMVRLDLPRHDNSAMDGYAVRVADVPAANTVLPVQQRSYAGQVPAPLRAGHATRLFTGSLMPAGADAVVVQEVCRETEAGVEIGVVPQAGSHVRFKGEDMAAGQLALRAGTLLGAAEIALLAAQGLAQALVFPRIRVGILTTGDELVTPGEPLRDGAIYDSNAPMLASLCIGLGTLPPSVRHAPDDLTAIAQALQALAETCDLVLSVGGASVGDKDLVKPAVEALGGALDLWRVRMKPGKPVALARLAGRPLVCLPGNPVSSFVVFTLLVSPLIRRLQGRSEPFPSVQRGILGGALVRGDAREEFLRVQVHSGAGLPLLEPHAQQSSGAVGTLAWAQGLARVPAASRVPPGAELSWYALRDWLC